MNRYRPKVAFTLYGLASLALVAVLAITTVSIHFATHTRQAAIIVAADGIKGRRMASRLELLLQQHRLIVESAPAEIDRDRLAAARRQLRIVGERLESELKETSAGAGPRTPSGTRLAESLAQDLPDLLATGEDVMALAWDFVQDKAVALAQGPYSALADRMQIELSAWAEGRTAILLAQVARLEASADTLVSRVLTCAGAALLLAVLTAATVHYVLQRFARVRDAMLRLAESQVDVLVPSLDRNDEIGQVAAAVQHFKLGVMKVVEQEAALKQTTARLELALENMSQGLCLYDAEDRLVVYNRRFVELYGFDPEGVRAGMTFRELLEFSAASGHHPEMTTEELLASRLDRHQRPNDEIILQSTGQGRTIAISEQSVADGGWVVTYEDVTGRRAAEQKVVFMARHDALTALPNRLVLDERLQLAIADAGRGTAFAVLFLDLDNFKTVNDTLGHRVGDKLLRAVSDRLLACIRENDMVARMGGDEFAIIQGAIARPEDASQLAQRIIDTVATPLEIEGNHIVVGASIGIALAPQDGTHPEKLLCNADMALYRAKAEGRGTFCYFEAEMDARLQNRRQLEMALRTALQANQFELFYQPVVNLERCEVSGFEALLRWRHPQRGLVSPAEFIPMLEETGLIVPVGAWVLTQACKDAATWPDAIKVAVNLSSAQFKGPHLARTVGAALKASGLPAARLELEITETLLLQNSEATLATLHELHELGVTIAMDDFGTGYSSLSYLRSFPFDKVKIDQSFIRDLSVRANSIHVVRAVTGLCAGLGIATTAEGVETRDQLHKLRSEGCTEVQGFLFSKPEPAEYVHSIIEAARSLARECDAVQPALAPS